MAKKSAPQQRAQRLHAGGEVEARLTRGASIKDCKTCKHFNDGCYHPSNIGILIKYRQQSQFCVKSCEELNKEGICLNYEQI